MQFQLFVFYKPACLQKNFHERALSIRAFSADGHYGLARVKNAVRMRAFPASGANLPLKLYAIPKLDSGREIQKSKLHTQKISLELHEHKVY